MIAELALGYVTLARLVEMALARRNTARLLAKGGHEVAGGHYPLIIAMPLQPMFHSCNGAM